MTDATYDRITSAFIDERPIMVTVIRRQRVAIAGGAWEWRVEGALPSQRCRQVFKGNVSDVSKRTLADGRIVTVQATLVFQFDADISEGDLVILPDEGQWEVARVLSRYALDAEVFRHG